ERTSFPTARRIERNLRLDILERLHIFSRLRHVRTVEVRSREHGILAADPANTSFDHVLEACVSPRPLVVSPCGVAESRFPLRANPRPWFLQITVCADFQNSAVLLVVLGVNVGLVPA